MRKILSLLLVAALVLALVPALALATITEPRPLNERITITATERDGNGGETPFTAFHTIPEADGSLSVFITEEPAWLSNDREADYLQFHFQARNADDTRGSGNGWWYPKSFETRVFSNLVSFDYDGDRNTTEDAEELEIHFHAAYYATQVPADRIAPDTNMPNANKAQGTAMYSANAITDGNITAVTTGVRANSYASSAKVNGTDATWAANENMILITTTDLTQNSTYTIQWFNRADQLVATETFTVSITPAYTMGFTDVAISDITFPQFDKMTVTYPDGKTSLSSTDTVQIHFNGLTAEDWREVYHESLSSEEIALPIIVQLPNNAINVGNMGTNGETTDADIFPILNAGHYYETNSNKIAVLDMPVATTNQNGTDLLITPIPNRHSVLYKYRLDDGTEGFKRINLFVTFGPADDGSALDPSPDIITLPNYAPAATRLIPNYPVTSETPGDVIGEVVNGQVNYSLTTEPTRDFTICTTIVPPAGAASASYQEPGAPYPEQLYPNNDGTFYVSTYMNRTQTSRMQSLPIQWFDAQGDLLCTEHLTISIVSSYAGTWLDDHWIPVPAARTNVIHAENAEHLTYTEGTAGTGLPGQWVFDLDFDSVDLPLVTSSSRMISITPPTAAETENGVVPTHYKESAWHTSLYGAQFAEDVVNIFADPSLSASSISDEANGGFLYYDGTVLALPLGGRPCNLTPLYNDDLTVLTVRGTDFGYTDSVHIQWYDAQGNLIRIKGADGNYYDGEFVHLTRKSTAQVWEEAVETEDFTENDGAVDHPTVVIPNDRGGHANRHQHKLKTDTPYQEESQQADYYYQCVYLTYVDENGKPIDPQVTGNGMIIYLPYPTGINMNNAHLFTFVLDHYNDAFTTTERVTVTPTPHGLRFEVTHLSPFVLAWAPANNAAPIPEPTLPGLAETTLPGTVPGVQVSGTMDPGTQLQTNGADDGCDPLIPEGTLGQFRLQLTNGSAYGPLTVQLPVNAPDGTIVTLNHCNKGVPQAPQNLPVQNGRITFQVDRLGTFTITRNIPTVDASVVALPKTGTAGSAYGVILLLCAAALTVLILRRRSEKA